MDRQVACERHCTTVLIDEIGSFTTGGKHGVDFTSRYLQSEEYRQLRAKVDPIFDGLQQEEKASGMADRFINKKQNSIKYATSFLWQVSATYTAVPPSMCTRLQV